MILDRRPHQRRLAIEALAGIDVGAGLDEGLEQRHVAGARHAQDHGLALPQGDVGIGAGLQQRDCDLGIPPLRRDRQRRHAIPGRGVHVRSAPDQLRHRGGVVGLDGTVQRGDAGGVYVPRSAKSERRTARRFALPGQGGRRHRQ
jgi:hypothetical protein